MIETAWTFDAAKHLYQTYQKAPQSALDMVICVITFNTCVTKELDAETYNQSIYKIDYNNKNIENNVGNNNFQKDNKDSDFFTADHNAFDHATLHELGHVVDRKYGFSSKYGNWDYRNISNWNEYDINNINEVKLLINDYLSNMNDKTKYTDDEIEVMKELGILIVSKSIQNLNTLMTEIIDIKFNNRIDVDNLVESNFIRNLINSTADKQPWLHKNEIKEMDNVSFHQGYEEEKIWYSYNIKVTNKTKISDYQLRCPSDDFAESFATYYINISKAKEAIVNTSHKEYLEWIQNNVDTSLGNRKKPDSTSGEDNEN